MAEVVGGSAQGGNVPVGSPSSAPAPAVSVANAIDLLKQIVAMLAAILGQPMDSVGRSRLPKLRKKALRLIKPIIDLAIEKPGLAPMGEDLQALSAEWELVSQLLALLSNASSFRKSVGDAVLKREAEVWQAVLVIYGVMQAQAKRDPAVAEMVAQMQAAMSNGPKAQKSVKAPIEPTPVKGKGAKEAQLAVARSKAGIPEPHAVAVTPQQGPRVAPAPSPVPPVASNGSGGPVSGQGH